MPIFSSIIKSGPKPYREETFQEWEARVEESRLKSEYVKSLTENPKKRPYPLPNFDIKSLYSSADFTDKKTKKILRQATDAIINNDFEALQKTLGRSAIPFRIVHAQKTHLRRWAWPAAYRTLQFYKYAETLFWWHQKKFFLETLPNDVRVYQGVVVKNPKTKRTTTRKGPLLQQAMDSIRNYYDRIIPASYSADQSEFLIDLYARNMEAEENTLSKKWLDFLIASESTDRYKDAISRGKATKETRHAIIEILRTQLSDFTFSVAVKNQFSEDEPAAEQKSFSLSAIIDNLDPSSERSAVESPEPSSDSDLNLDDMSDEEQSLLAANDKTQVKQFLIWLNKCMTRKVDIVEIGNAIAELVEEQMQICQELVKKQAYASEILCEKESELEDKLSDELKASAIANASLDDFPVSDKNPVPLLHLALEKYANAQTEVEQNEAFQPVVMLIGRGCSPYLSLSMHTPDSSRTKCSALEYAMPQPDWRLLTCILRYTLPQNQFAERMRQKLLEYCFNASNHSQSLQYRIFYHSKFKSAHTELVAELVKALHDARFNKSEISLMAEIANIRNKNKVTFFKPKLFQLLDDILPKKDKKPGSNDAVEMGSLRSENNSPQTPSIGRLSEQNIFSVQDVERGLVLPDTEYTTIQIKRAI
jgi:hypothetical protein